MRVFVTGVNGQLGHDVMQLLSERKIECLGCGSSEAYRGINDTVASLPYVQLDICDKSAVYKAIGEYKPDAIIHCAAWTNDEAAEDILNREALIDLNVNATEYLAEISAELDSKMVYISSDYVFSGEGKEAHLADDSDFNPINEYGRSKLQGEFAVKRHLKKYFIVRTSWLFGQNGGNFVKTIIKAGHLNDEVFVVNDQIGSPTYSLHLARLLCDMIESDKYGVYHGTNSGEFISWYDFTCEIYRLAHIDTKVTPVSTAKYQCTAKRPANSRLDKSKLIEHGFEALPHWKDALKEFIEI